jgi:aminoglycoside 2'-N-acetyltransferase I
MSIDIEILNGDASWPSAQPLLNAIWPAGSPSALPWREDAAASADFRVLVDDPERGLVCHAGIYRRHGRLNGHPVHIGGIGAVATHPDHQRRGLATLALNAALQTLKHEGSIGFALLFCEPQHLEFFATRGGKRFDGEIIAEQPDGRGPFEALTPLVFDLIQRPRSGTIDLLGPPW